MRNIIDVFVESIKNDDCFKILENGNPVKILFESKEYYVYLRSLTSAYLGPDVTRAQLPSSPIFEDIKKSPIPFIFLGYDLQNDIFACWNFIEVKSRLNEAKMVSLYSRESAQKKATKNNFLRLKLKNNDNVILFKRNNIHQFFCKIDTFFTDTKTNNFTEKQAVVKNNIENSRDNKNTEITDKELLKKIEPLLTGQTIHSLEAVSIVLKYYSNQNVNLTIKECNNLIKNIDFSDGSKK